MPDPIKQSIEFYENEALKYDEKRWNTEGGRYNYKIQTDIVINYLDDWKGKKVLDIATGTGRFALELAKRGADVTVLDSSLNMLTIVKDKFNQIGLEKKLHLQHGLATELDFPENEFDVCICINALNHIPNYSDVLREIYRVLKPGGVSITNYTNWVSYYLPFGLFVNLKKKSLVRDVYTKWFSIKEILSLHKINHLEVKKISGAVHIPGKINNTILITILRITDRISRSGIFKYIAPQIFIQAIKK